MMAIIRYEEACSNPEIPFQDYVVIVERSFMEEYFNSIITPNGTVVLSEWVGSGKRRGKPFDPNKDTWKR